MRCEACRVEAGSAAARGGTRSAWWTAQERESLVGAVPAHQALTVRDRRWNVAAGQRDHAGDRIADGSVRDAVTRPGCFRDNGCVEIERVDDVALLDGVAKGMMELVEANIGRPLEDGPLRRAPTPAPAAEAPHTPSWLLPDPLPPCRPPADARSTSVLVHSCTRSWHAEA